jgi:hypothetical protein
MMTFHLIASLAGAALIGLGSTAVAAPPQNESERSAALKTLQWKEGEDLKLPLSQGKLHAPANIMQLSGTDAATLYGALNGVDAPTGTEAVLYDSRGKTLVYYQKVSDGFVKLDDWDDVDADAMLKAVSENTENANAKRQAAGLSPIHVVGWLQRPQLQKSTSTVQWAFEADDGQSGPLVNSVTLLEAHVGRSEECDQRRVAEGGRREFQLPCRRPLHRLQEWRQGCRIRHRRSGRGGPRREACRQAGPARRGRDLCKKIWGDSGHRIRRLSGTLQEVLLPSEEHATSPTSCRLTWQSSGESISAVPAAAAAFRPGRRPAS